MSQLSMWMQFQHRSLVIMSVTMTESDLPRFFLGAEEGEELLDQAASSEFDSFYDHIEDEEYDSVRIAFDNG